MCLYTKYILNKKYLPTKKNKYNPPECHDERLRYVPIKCGKCMECRKQKKREWYVRLSEELKKNRGALFLTLTFNENMYEEVRRAVNAGLQPTNEEENDMCRYAIRHWLELIRKRTGKSVKHWMISEKGEDYNRIHMHGIVWCSKEDVDAWRYGYTYIGDYVNSKTINYITKYMLKINENCPEFIGKVFCSQGIGRGYENSTNARRNRYQGERTIETYKAEDGRELPMPKYYHDKIYSEEEREKLWVIKQERGYRYIGGEKCSTEDLEEWDNLTRYYQRRGVEVFGDKPDEWERDKQRRRLERMRIARRRMRGGSEVPRVSTRPEGREPTAPIINKATRG